MKIRNHPPERRLSISPLALFLGLGVVLPVLAQEPFVYPANGQSPEKMSADKAQCQVWATGQTGFDPLNAATTPAAPEASARHGGLLKGGARGAAGGAAIGAIAGNAGKGAEIGAVAGGVLGGARRRREQQTEQQAQAQQAQVQSREKDDHLRAYGACLKGRGYSVD